MARTKGAKNKVKKRSKKAAVVSPFKQIDWSESYASLLLGLIVVLAMGLIGFSFIRASRHIMRTATSSIATSIFDEQKQPIQLDRKYTVVTGDDLSVISQKFYQTNEHWLDIAQANNLLNPNEIPAGTVLRIPKVSPTPFGASITPTPAPTGTANAISGNSYTVADGDYIWDIAVRAYGDGYRAPDIIKANNLLNPDQLSAGSILKIPRP